MFTIKKAIVIVLSIMLSFALAITGSFKVTTIIPLLIGAFLSNLISNRKEPISKLDTVICLMILLLPILGYGFVKIKATQLLAIINIMEGILLLGIIGLNINKLSQNYKKSIFSLVITIICLGTFYYNGYLSITTHRLFLNLIPLIIIIFATIYDIYPILFTARKHLLVTSVIIAFLFALGNY